MKCIRPVIGSFRFTIIKINTNLLKIIILIWVDFTIYFYDTRLYISMISLTQLFGVRNLWYEVDISVVLDREGVFGMGENCLYDNTSLYNIWPINLIVENLKISYL